MNNRNFEPDESQKLCLLTWYPEDHPLHYELRHPLMALVGELGEYLNLLKKAEYKPGYKLNSDEVEKELGDCWFYIRMIAYLGMVTIEDCMDANRMYFPDGTIELMEWDFKNDDSPLFNLVWATADMLLKYNEHGWLNIERVTSVVYIFWHVTKEAGYTLDQLTRSNYLKLVDPETGKGIHGWKAAKDYTSGD